MADPGQEFGSDPIQFDQSRTFLLQPLFFGQQGNVGLEDIQGHGIRGCGWVRHGSGDYTLKYPSVARPLSRIPTVAISTRSGPGMKPPVNVA